MKLANALVTEMKMVRDIIYTK